MDTVKRRWLIIIFLAIVIIVGSFCNARQKNIIPERVEAPRQVYVEPEITICISGAVNKPGLYKLKPGSRVLDAVKAAGGLALQANDEKVNLAKLLQDGMHINIAAKKSVAVVKKKANTNKTAKAIKKPATKADSMININSASQSELESLPGIGPALAARIITYRQVKGPFEDIKDLMKVKGIGKAKFRELQSQVVL